MNPLLLKQNQQTLTTRTSMAKLDKSNAEDNKRQIMDYLSLKQFPEKAIPAIMANIEVETGGTFNPQQKQLNAKNPAYGLFQFDKKGKYNDYKKWLGKERDNLYAQIDYFHDTIYGDKQNTIGKKVAERIRNSFENDSSIDITRTLSDQWFRPGKPNMNKRLIAANKYIPQDQQQTDPTAKPQPPYAVPQTMDFGPAAGMQQPMQPQAQLSPQMMTQMAMMQPQQDMGMAELAGNPEYMSNLFDEDGTIAGNDPMQQFLARAMAADNTLV